MCLPQFTSEAETAELKRDCQARIDQDLQRAENRTGLACSAIAPGQWLLTRHLR